MTANEAPENTVAPAHTPGPWVVDGKRIRTEAIRFDGAVRGPTVAQVDKGAVGYEQTQANARLIASAPELLEALKAAHAWIIAPDERQNNDPRPLILQLGEAIRHAEGK